MRRTPEELPAHNPYAQPSSLPPNSVRQPDSVTRERFLLLFTSRDLTCSVRNALARLAMSRQTSPNDFRFFQLKAQQLPNRPSTCHLGVRLMRGQLKFNTIFPEEHPTIQVPDVNDHQFCSTHVDEDTAASIATRTRMVLIESMPRVRLWASDKDLGRHRERDRSSFYFGLERSARAAIFGIDSTAIMNFDGF